MLYEAILDNNSIDLLKFILYTKITKFINVYRLVLKRVRAIISVFYLNILKAREID